ncbi:hypothetical protein DRO37_00050 [Candidatus Bathyarchaeota archaeon]|nr:MAG: hypothetical protein DRO37_00050 [Candidatus Bathyarchaeota archaeon]
MIKACESLIVGFLAEHNQKLKLRLRWKALHIASRFRVESLLAIIGFIYYNGEGELTLGHVTYKFMLP